MLFWEVDQRVTDAVWGLVQSKLFCKSMFTKSGRCREIRKAGFNDTWIKTSLTVRDLSRWLVPNDKQRSL